MLLRVQNFAIVKNFSSQKQNSSHRVMSYPADSVSFTGNTKAVLKGLREISLTLFKRAEDFHLPSNIFEFPISDKIISFRQRAYPNAYIEYMTKDNKVVYIFKDHPLTILSHKGPVAKFLVAISPKNVDIFTQKLSEKVSTYFIDENGVVTRNKNEISLSILMPPSEYKDEFIPVTDEKELSALIKHMQEFNENVSAGLTSRGY